MRINVYTDGACSNNGKPTAKAGIGIYFGENDSRNYCSRISGRQTNNCAEIIAIIITADILSKELQAGYNINIYSDSMYAMRACTEYGAKLDALNWESKKPIPNLELVKRAYETFKQYDNVTFNYIAAHTGLMDEHSLGNEGADRWANMAIGLTNNKKTKPKNIYINLPYSEKDEGKRLGAKWDPKKKKWYIPFNSNNKQTILNRWPAL